MERTFNFVRNVKGSISMTLESFDFSAPAKKFVIPYNINKIVIPYKFALGLFVSGPAYDFYKSGAFIIEDAETLIKDAVEKGLCAMEEFPEILSLVNIEKIVKSNSYTKINGILKGGNKVEIDNLLTVAKENIATLNTNCKNLIEQHCGVELEIE